MAYFCQRVLATMSNGDGDTGCHPRCSPGSRLFHLGLAKTSWEVREERRQRISATDLTDVTPQTRSLPSIRALLRLPRSGLSLAEQSFSSVRSIKRASFLLSIAYFPFSAIENRSLSSQQGPYPNLEKEMAPMAQYIPPKVAKRYGLCHTAEGMILIPEEASSSAHGADSDAVWLAVGPGACVAHHGHVPAKQVRFSLH
jgi:hypothetical protein